MKTFLKISAAGILMALPAVAGASQLNFESTSPCYTLLFDPSGCGSSTLPKSYFYRSYDCRIGPVYTPPKIVLTTPPPTDNTPKGNNQTPPPQNNPSNNGGNDGGNNNPSCNNPPVVDTPPVNPIVTPPPCDPAPAAVPAPESAAMAGVGLGVMGIFGWLRSRRQARA